MQSVITAASPRALPSPPWWRGQAMLALWGPLALIVAGVGVFAQAYLAEPDSAAAYAWFWIGHALCFAGALTFGLGGARARRHLAALALLAGALYLPIFLRGADRPHFNDELFHVQVMEAMRERGVTQVPFTNYPLPGDYPGLEFLGLAIGSATGLPTVAVVRLCALLLHVLILASAYLALRALLPQPRAAFIGALVYSANASFYFIHSLFSYETLGIMLFLLVCGLAARVARTTHAMSGRDRALLLLAIPALVATHHFSGLMMIAMFASFTAAAAATRHPLLRRFARLLLFSTVVWLSWLVLRTYYTFTYLLNTTGRRLSLIGEALQQVLWSGTGTSSVRPLFQYSPLPLWERVYAASYPVMVLAIVVLGLWAVRARRARGERLPLAWLAFGIFGPALWIMSAPAILTGGSDAIFRSWPFLFLGVALYAMIGLPALLRRLRVRRGAILPLAGVCAGALLAGSVIIGDNQAGRFRSIAPATAAGATAITADLLSASDWLRETAGPLHRVAGDRASQVSFATVGQQVTGIWGVWALYFEPSAARAERILDVLGIDYAVVDWRVTRLPPRSHGLYYGLGEPEVVPVPAAQLKKFEEMPQLERVYDSGDIVIYARRQPDRSAVAALEQGGN